MEGAEAVSTDSATAEVAHLRILPVRGDIAIAPRAKADQETLTDAGRGVGLQEDMARSDLSERMRAYLTELARRRGTMTYRDLARALQVQPPNTIRQVAGALEVLMQEDLTNGVPFLAALVVSRVGNGLPAPAFFFFAGSLGRFEGSGTGPETPIYHAQELKSAWDHWGNLNERP